MSFNRFAFNGGTFNGVGPAKNVAADSESTPAIGEAEGIGTSDAESLWLNPEGDTAGPAGTFNSFTFNGAGFNDAIRVRGADWSLLVSFTDAESTPTAGETEQVLQSIVLNLGGTEPSFVDAYSLRLEWELNRRARCGFRVNYPGALPSYYTPRAGHRVKIYDFDGVTVLFHGSIEKVGDMLLNSDGSKLLFVDVEAVGWEQIADRFLVVKTYDTQDLDVIVADLVTSYLVGEGVTATGLPAGVAVADKLVFSYLRVSDCFDELSKRTGYWWRIDDAKNVVFYSPATASAAPLAIDANGLNYRSLKASRDRSQYRNRQYLANVVTTITPPAETFSGDLTNQAFSLKYALNLVPAITVNAVAATVGIRDVDTGKDFYWSKHSAEIVPETGAARVAGDSVVVTYTGEFEQVVIRENAAEIADRTSIEGGTGVYEWLTGDGVSLNTLASAQAYADGLIDRNAPIPSVVTIEADDAGLVLPGQYVTITEPALGLSGNFFASRVSAEVLPGTQVVRRTIECSSSQPEEVWAQAFKKAADGTDRTDTPISGP